MRTRCLPWRAGYPALSPRDEFGNVEFQGRAIANPANPWLAARFTKQGAPLAGQLARARALDPGAAQTSVVVSGGHDRDPDLILDLLVQHRPEDDVGLGVRGLGHRL